MNRTIGYIFIMVVVALAHGRAYGTEPVFIHGFISQGFIKSFENDMIPHSKDGSFELNEMGINFTTHATPQLRMGAQLFARDFGEYGNDRVILDWAFADYRYKPWLGIRAGRLKIVNGLYNVSRDIDSSRTFILMPGVYMNSFREIFVGVKGMSVHGYLPGGFSYVLSGGAIDNPTNFKDSFLFDILVPLAFRGAASVATGIPVENFTNVRPLSVTWRDSLNLGLIWETPLPGLKLSATYWGGRAETEMYAEVNGDPYQVNAKFSKIGAYVTSIEYSILGTTVAAEYMLAPFYAKDGPRRKLESWYVSIAYRLNRFLEVGTYYSELYPHYDDHDGSQEREGVPPHYYYHKEVCTTLRIDINYNWILKLEGHAVYGTALNPATYNVSNPEDTPKRWGMCLAKVCYNF